MTAVIAHNVVIVLERRLADIDNSRVFIDAGRSGPACS
jgi:hypothetical protein